MGGLRDCELGGVKIVGSSWAGGPCSDRAIDAALLHPGCGVLIVDREKGVLMGYL